MNQPWVYDPINQRYNWQPDANAAPGQLDSYLKGLGAMPAGQQAQQASNYSTANPALGQQEPQAYPEQRPQMARDPAPSSNGATWPGQGVGQLTLRNQNGQTEVVDASNYQEIDRLTRSGWLPLNAQGHPYQVNDFQDSGGQVFTDPDSGGTTTLNGMLGGQLSAEQQAGLAGYHPPTITNGSGVATPGGTTGNVNPPQVGNGGYGYTSNPANNGGMMGPDGLLHFPDAQGNEFSPNMVPSVNVEAPGQIPGQYSKQFDDSYFGMMNNAGSQIKDQYNYEMPQNQAAQMNLGDIPQPTAQQYGTSDELAKLLSGQGYDPATLARMRAQAGDSVSAQGRAAMSAGRIGLEQAGLQFSPAGAAIQGDIARQTAQQQNSANNDILINDAQTGMENMRQGVSQQTNIGLSNMQQANQMALQNASMLFSGMGQNLSNQQQAGQTQWSALNNQKLAQANQTSNTLGNISSQWAGSALSKQNNADTDNVNNRQTWAQNQGQAERQRQLQNQGVQENRYQQANGLTGANYGVS